MAVKMTLFVGLLLGIIQGLTEFLPVSSTAHLAIAQDLLTRKAPDAVKAAVLKEAAGIEDVKIEEITKGDEKVYHVDWNAADGKGVELMVSANGEVLSREVGKPVNAGQSWLVFDVMLHLGTLLAVLLYFRREVWGLVRGFFTLCLSVSKGHRPQPGSESYENRRLLLYMIAASIPTAIIALLIKKSVERFLEDLVVVSIFMMITGVILFVTRSFSEEGRLFSKMRCRDSLIIGTIQGLAALPGISRSGSTIATGIFLKLDRTLAAKFSFLISIPAIFGAALVESKGLRSEALLQIWPTIVVGILAAFVTGYFAIALVFRILQKRKFAWFAPYCWAAGIAAILIGLLRGA